MTTTSHAVPDESLVPSIAIESLILRRNQTLERIRALFAEITSLSQTTQGMDAGKFSDWFTDARYRSDLACDKNDPMEYVRKRIDAKLWLSLMNKSGNLTFMDAERRQQWRSNLHELKDVPEITANTVYQTFRTLRAQRGTMFKNGVIELVRRCCWDYTSNRPGKLGTRWVKTFACDPWDYGRPRVAFGRPSDTLSDLDRVMHVLDKKPEPDHRSGLVSQLNRFMSRDNSTPFENGYYKIRWFRNQNIHVHFKRPDLIDQLNQIVAEHYPSTLTHAT